MSPFLAQIPCRVAKLVLPLLLALSVAGCGTLNPDAELFASVTILNHPEEQIATTTVQVFRENGYRGGAANVFEMVFEKPAGTAATVSREGVWATQQGAQTMDRVRAEIVGLGGGKRRLQCQAYMVSGAGDAVFEDEVPLARIRSGPYQAMLSEVAKRLK